METSQQPKVSASKLRMSIGDRPVDHLFCHEVWDIDSYAYIGTPDEGQIAFSCSFDSSIEEGEVAGVITRDTNGGFAFAGLIRRAEHFQGEHPFTRISIDPTRSWLRVEPTV